MWLFVGLLFGLCVRCIAWILCLSACWMVLLDNVFGSVGCVVLCFFLLYPVWIVLDYCSWLLLNGGVDSVCDSLLDRLDSWVYRRYLNLTRTKIYATTLTLRFTLLGWIDWFIDFMYELRVQHATETYQRAFLQIKVRTLLYPVSRAPSGKDIEYTWTLGKDIRHFRISRMVNKITSRKWCFLFHLSIVTHFHQAGEKT